MHHGFYLPNRVGVDLQQAVLGDRHYPVGQHGQVQVRLDASVGLVELAGLGYEHGSKGTQVFA